MAQTITPFEAPSPGALSFPTEIRLTRTRLLSNLITLILLIVLSALAIGPLIWLLSGSVKVNAEIFSYPPRLIPNNPTLDGYTHVFDVLPFGRYFVNTTFIALMRVVATVASASLVAFGFARYGARGKNLLFILILSPMFLPEVITLVPLFVSYQRLGWIDTYLPLIVPAFFGGKAVFIFLMRQFLLTIPNDLDEAARIDGASEFGIFWRIILPLAKPALATVAIFTFMESWNDFLFPLIFINSTDRLTLTVGMSRLVGQMGATEWNGVMAIALLSVVPPMVLFVVAQRYFVQGIVTSGIKG